KLRFEQIVAADGPDKVAAILSPFMSCEEAWLLVKFIRKVAPQATLALGPVPTSGEDQKFPVGKVNGKPPRFTVRAEKCPNRRGVEMVLKAAGGSVIQFTELLQRAAKGAYAAAWISGGYPTPWVPKELASAAAHVKLIVLQDILPSELSETAAIVIPSCAWAEREGTFVNHAGLVQPFTAPRRPPVAAHRAGQSFHPAVALAGLYRAAKVREQMSAEIPEMAKLHVPPPKPVHLH